MELNRNEIMFKELNIWFIWIDWWWWLFDSWTLINYNQDVQVVLFASCWCSCEWKSDWKFSTLWCFRYYDVLSFFLWFQYHLSLNQASFTYLHLELVYLCLLNKVWKRLKENFIHWFDENFLTAVAEVKNLLYTVCAKNLILMYCGMDVNRARNQLIL